jgi:hypothetical protein
LSEYPARPYETGKNAAAVEGTSIKAIALGAVVDHHQGLA